MERKQAHNKPVPGKFREITVQNNNKKILKSYRGYLNNMSSVLCLWKFELSTSLDNRASEV